MKYQNGEIILAKNEADLLSSFTKKEVDQTCEVLMFVGCMHALKQEVLDLLADFKDDPEFIANEKEVRTAMNFMTLVCDQFRAKAVMLAKVAGDDIALE